MQASATHPSQRHAQRRRPALAAVGVLALLAACAGSPARADETHPAPPYAVQPAFNDAPPFAMAPPSVPEPVQAAISSLVRACAAWPRPLPGAGLPPSNQPVSVAPERSPIERDVCDVATNPGGSFSQLLWFGGIMGGVATVFGLMGFCLLRAVLVSLWNWRPRSLARMR